MTILEQMALLSIFPVGALLIGFVVYWTAKREREQHRTH